MRIGVDIDGTLYPWTLSVNEAVEEKFGLTDLTEHTHWNYLYDLVTKEQWAWIWSKDAAEAVFGRPNYYPGSVEAVRQLIEAGHEIHFVTHRNPTSVSEITARWIQHYFEGYAGLHVLDNKVSKTSLGNWDVFIDDKPDTIEEFLVGTDTLMFVPSRLWNQDVQGGIRFDNWQEVLDELGSYQTSLSS